MTLAIMRNNILRFCPGLNPDIISSTINDAYRQLGMMEWNRLNIVKSIYTTAPYSTGHVTVTSAGVVTSVGATFDATMVGKQMRVYFEDSFFEILTATPPSTLTLQGWPGLTLATNQDFTIFGLIYPVNSAMMVVNEVAYQTSLDKKSQDFFNRRDPQRSTTGSPTWWAYAGYNIGGYPLIEIYPVADQVYPLRCYGKAGIVTLADGDTPYIPETLLENRALLDCYRIKAIQDPKGGWEARVQTQQAFYQSIFDVARDEDYQLGSHRDKVKDYMDTMEDYPPSDSFWASHDVE